MCIDKILSTHNIRNLKELKVILSIALKELRVVNDTKTNICEELVELALNLIIKSLRNSHSNVLEELYVKSSISILSNLCLVCVRIIENLKYRSLKIKAVHCLNCLYYVDSSSDFHDKIIRNEAANCLYLFIPKIIKILVVIAVGDDVQGNNLKLVISCFIKNVLQKLFLISRRLWNLFIK